MKKNKIKIAVIGGGLVSPPAEPKLDILNKTENLNI